MTDLTTAETKITLDIVPFTVENGGSVINLCRHHNGKLEADRLGIADFVREYDTVVLKFPDAICSVSPTYCRGLLEDALKAVGTVENLRKKVLYDCSPIVMRWMEIGLRNLNSGQPS